MEKHVQEKNELQIILIKGFGDFFSQQMNPLFSLGVNLKEKCSICENFLEPQMLFFFLMAKPLSWKKNLLKLNENIRLLPRRSKVVKIKQ